MRLWLSLELHILARVFGNGFDPDRDGLVFGMRDLQRQCLETQMVIVRRCRTSWYEEGRISPPRRLSLWDHGREKSRSHERVVHGTECQ